LKQQGGSSLIGWADMDLLLLIAAAICFLSSFGYTLYALRTGKFMPGSINFVAILLGFVFQTAFLYLRGKAEGSCPLNSLFDVLIFQSWSLVLTYLIVGPAYRLSLLGAFSAPIALLLIVVALIAPISREIVRRPGINPWVETHAALSIIAYGAFGLSSVAGIMYLLQERQLKSQKASSLLYNLPPINDLAAAIGRLMGFGLILLTISFAAGFISQMPVNTVKFWVSVAIWVAYGAMVLMNRIHSLAPRRLAELSIVVFAVALITLPGIQYLSSRP
jgi:HemX protein